MRQLLAQDGGVGSLAVYSSHKLLPYFGFTRPGHPLVCMDHSECEIEHNTVAGTRVVGENPSASGVAIESYYYAEAHVRHNTVIASPGGVRALDFGTISE